MLYNAFSRNSFTSNRALIIFSTITCICVLLPYLAHMLLVCRLQGACKGRLQSFLLFGFLHIFHWLAAQQNQIGVLIFFFFFLRGLWTHTDTRELCTLHYFIYYMNCRVFTAYCLLLHEVQCNQCTVYYLLTICC